MMTTRKGRRRIDSKAAKTDVLLFMVGPLSRGRRLGGGAVLLPLIIAPRVVWRISGELRIAV